MLCFVPVLHGWAWYVCFYVGKKALLQCLCNYYIMLHPCMFCVALSMDLFVLCVVCLTVFVNCLVPFGMLCLSDISIMFVEILLAVCILVGMVI